MKCVSSPVARRFLERQYGLTEAQAQAVLSSFYQRTGLIFNKYTGDIDAKSKSVLNDFMVNMAAHVEGLKQHGDRHMFLSKINAQRRGALTRKQQENMRIAVAGSLSNAVEILKKKFAQIKGNVDYDSYMDDEFEFIRNNFATIVASQIKMDVYKLLKDDATRETGMNIVADLYGAMSLAKASIENKYGLIISPINITTAIVRGKSRILYDSKANIGHVSAVVEEQGVDINVVENARLQDCADDEGHNRNDAPDRVVKRLLADIPQYEDVDFRNAPKNTFYLLNPNNASTRTLSLIERLRKGELVSDMDPVRVGNVFTLKALFVSAAMDGSFLSFRYTENRTRKNAGKPLKIIEAVRTVGGMYETGPNDMYDSLRAEYHAGLPGYVKETLIPLDGPGESHRKYSTAKSFYEWLEEKSARNLSMSAFMYRHGRNNKSIINVAGKKERFFYIKVDSNQAKLMTDASNGVTKIGERSYLILRAPNYVGNVINNIREDKFVAANENNPLLKDKGITIVTSLAFNGQEMKSVSTEQFKAHNIILFNHVNQDNEKLVAVPIPTGGNSQSARYLLTQNPFYNKSNDEITALFVDLFHREMQVRQKMKEVNAMLKEKGHTEIKLFDDHFFPQLMDLVDENGNITNIDEATKRMDDLLAEEVAAFTEESDKMSVVINLSIKAPVKTDLFYLSSKYIQMNYILLMQGSPALFQTAGTLSFRNKQAITNVTELYPEGNPSEPMKVIYVKDVEMDATSEEVEHIGVDEKDKAQKITDGQGFVSLDEWIDVNTLNGTLTGNELEALRFVQNVRKQNIKAGIGVDGIVPFNDMQKKTFASFNARFPNIKTLNYGFEPVITIDEEGNEHTTYIPFDHKMSEIVLIPELEPAKVLADGTTILDVSNPRVRVGLMLARVDRVYPESALKIAPFALATTSSTNAYIHNIPRTHYGVQQRTKVKTNYPRINYSIQLLKSFLSADGGEVVAVPEQFKHLLKHKDGMITAKELRAAVLNTVVESTESKCKAFINSLSNRDEFLLDIISNMAEHPEYSPSQIAGYIANDQNLLYDDAHKEIDKFVMSLFNNIRSFNGYGSALYQISSLGITNAEGKPLKVKFNEDGTVIEHVEIAIPFDITVKDKSGTPVRLRRDDWVNRDGTPKIDPDTDMPLIETYFPSILSMHLSRRPYEGERSGFHGRVVRFLPEYCGAQVACPAVMQYIAGFDFDIDALYTLQFDYTLDNDYTEVVKDGNLNIIYTRPDLLKAALMAKDEFLKKKKLKREKPIYTGGHNTLLAALITGTLTEQNAEQVRNVGDFTVLRKAAIVGEALKAGFIMPEVNEGETFEQVKARIIDEAEAFMKKNQISFSPTTFDKYFGGTNIGKAAVGVFATSTTAMRSLSYLPTIELARQNFYGKVKTRFVEYGFDESLISNRHLNGPATYGVSLWVTAAVDAFKADAITGQNYRNLGDLKISVAAAALGIDPLVITMMMSQFDETRPFDFSFSEPWGGGVTPIGIVKAISEAQRTEEGRLSDSDYNNLMTCITNLKQLGTTLTTIGSTVAHKESSSIDGLMSAIVQSDSYDKNLETLMENQPYSKVHINLSEMDQMDASEMFRLASPLDAIILKYMGGIQSVLLESFDDLLEVNFASSVKRDIYPSVDAERFARLSSVLKTIYRQRTEMVYEDILNNPPETHLGLNELFDEEHGLPFVLLPEDMDAIVDQEKIKKALILDHTPLFWNDLKFRIDNPVDLQAAIFEFCQRVGASPATDWLVHILANMSTKWERKKMGTYLRRYITADLIMRYGEPYTMSELLNDMRREADVVPLRLLTDAVLANKEDLHDFIGHIGIDENADPIGATVEGDRMTIKVDMADPVTSRYVVKRHRSTHETVYTKRAGHKYNDNTAREKSQYLAELYPVMNLQGRTFVIQMSEEYGNSLVRRFDSTGSVVTAVYHEVDFEEMQAAQDAALYEKAVKDYELGRAQAASDEAQYDEAQYEEAQYEEAQPEVDDPNGDVADAMVENDEVLPEEGNDDAIVDKKDIASIAANSRPTIMILLHETDLGHITSVTFNDGSVMEVEHPNGPLYPAGKYQYVIAESTKPGRSGAPVINYIKDPCC